MDNNKWPIVKWAVWVWSQVIYATDTFKIVFLGVKWADAFKSSESTQFLGEGSPVESAEDDGRSL